MTDFEIIETIDPPADAMVRSFHCQICDKAHLQTGEIVRIWVKYQEGYASQATPICCGINRATKADINRIWRKLWGDATEETILWHFEAEYGEYLDLTQNMTLD